MKPLWIIEIGVFDEDRDIELMREIDKQGYQFLAYNYVPMSTPPEILSRHITQPVIFRGSLETSKRIRKNTDWSHGIYATLDDYKCSSYYPYLENYLLNSDYVILPYGSLSRQRHELFSSFSENDSIFIRPNDGDKQFTGKVVHKENFEKDLESFLFGSNVEPSTLCLISSPKNILTEWRMVIADWRIIASSIYKNDNKNVLIDMVPDFLLEHGRRILKELYKTKFSFHDRIWTMDMCLLENSLVQVLEIGCFSCAGLYKCNLDQIVKIVSETTKDSYVRRINEDL